MNQGQLEALIDLCRQLETRMIEDPQILTTIDDKDRFLEVVLRIRLKP